jgi:AraC-like DNA-binding protein/mannose-6-phosphate isomerase-like protein (cupin superfamily)
MNDFSPDELERDIPPTLLRRLTSEQFMAPHSSLQIDHHLLPGRVKVHWHEFYEMFFVVAGTGTHVLNGTAFPLAPGSLFLLTPADFHEIIPQEGITLDLFNVIFADDMLEGEIQHLLSSEIRDYFTQCDGATFSLLEAEFRRLWLEATERRVGYRRVIQGAFERILIELVRQCGAVDDVENHPRPWDPQRKIHRALVYLHHHFREPLTLERVSKEAYLSPHYFSQCFHVATGSSFQAYLRALRLRFARSLLQVADMPITDICYASGFANLSHFERAFKQQYGQSPRSYRRGVDQGR